MKDYYDILGVPRDASQEDIKHAYRILAHQFHPDKNEGNDKRFKEINEAYRVVSGERTKAEYDAHYDSRFASNKAKEFDADPPPTTSRGRGWVGWLGFIVFIIIIRLIVSGSPFAASGGNATTTSVGTPVTSQLTGSTASSFPFSDPSAQYAWYDQNNVPMAYRCYTTMNPPCTDAEWQQATDSIPPQGSLSPVPSGPPASANEATIPVYTGANGTFSVTVPSGNSSTCVWTWTEGSGAIPYSQTTHATAGESNALSIPGAGGYLPDNFKVSCTDDFGDQYTGVATGQ